MPRNMKALTLHVPVPCKFNKKNENQEEKKPWKQVNCSLTLISVGAGVFVTAVVAGSIAIIKPFKSMERPFLRDVIFYLGATYWAWHVMWDKKITLMEAVGGSWRSWCLTSD